MYLTCVRGTVLARVVLGLSISRALRIAALVFGSIAGLAPTASVVAAGVSGAIRSTDEFGRGRLELPVGRYQYEVFAPGYKPLRSQMQGTFLSVGPHTAAGRFGLARRRHTDL